MDADSFRYCDACHAYTVPHVHALVESLADPDAHAVAVPELDAIGHAKLYPDANGVSHHHSNLDSHRDPFPVAVTFEYADGHRVTHRYADPHAHAVTDALFHSDAE